MADFMSLYVCFVITGQAMQYQSQIFLSRNWEVDRKELEQKLFYLVGLDQPLQLLLFPEGRDFTAHSKKKSDEYADKHNLPHYDYCLHPHTRGLTYIVSAMRSGGLEAVYDVTLAYPDSIASTECEFVKGIMPKEVHFYIREYDAHDLPVDEQGLAQWCQQRWHEKEEMLHQYYQHKCFDSDKLSTPAMRICRGSDCGGYRDLNRCKIGMEDSSQSFWLVRECLGKKELIQLLSGFMFFVISSVVFVWLLCTSWLWCLVAMLSAGFVLYQSYLTHGMDYWILSHAGDTTDQAVQRWRRGQR